MVRCILYADETTTPREAQFLRSFFVCYVRLMKTHTIMSVTRYQRTDGVQRSYIYRTEQSRYTKPSTDDTILAYSIYSVVRTNPRTISTSSIIEYVQRKNVFRSYGVRFFFSRMEIERDSLTFPIPLPAVSVSGRYKRSFLCLASCEIVCRIL